eukprot:TRINITY_DN35127_c0_g1_i1.p1 TRINITY_DN35127_c0_g1~~TRINITY_DN35127_c0_g1_i1.p1  ORF type:complete len:435 (+),score=51.52 TRINITY_DN35127_c0_g1_i1:165-1469(+)
MANVHQGDAAWLIQESSQPLDVFSLKFLEALIRETPAKQPRTSSDTGALAEFPELAWIEIDESIRNQFSPEKFKEYAPIINAVMKGQRILKVASDDMRANRTVVMAAVSRDGMSLMFADPRLRADPEVVLAAISHCAEAILSADRMLRVDESFILRAIEKNSAVFQFLDTVWGNRLLAKAAVESDGLLLRFAKETVQRNAEVVLAAVCQNGEALKYAHPTLRADPQIVLAAVTRKGTALRHANHLLRNYRAIVIAALHNDPHAAVYSADDVWRETDFVVRVLNECVRFYSCPEIDVKITNLVTCDRGLVMNILTKQGSLLAKFPKPIRDDHEAVAAAVQSEGSALQYASRRLRQHPDLVRIAVLSQSSAAEYAIGSEARIAVNQVLNDKTRMTSDDLVPEPIVPIIGDEEEASHVLSVKSGFLRRLASRSFDVS